MTYQDLIYDKKDGVVVVTINVAMDTDLRQALRFSYLCAFAPHYRVAPPEQPGQAFMGKKG